MQKVSDCFGAQAQWSPLHRILNLCRRPRRRGQVSAPRNPLGLQIMWLKGRIEKPEIEAIDHKAVDQTCITPKGPAHLQHVGTAAVSGHEPVPDLGPPKWHSNLFSDMAEHMQTCVLTFFCPCITFGLNVEVLSKESNMGATPCFLASTVWCCLVMVGCPCLCSGYWRKRLRKKFNIPSGDCSDYCLHFWCGPCALCQEHRELRVRKQFPPGGAFCCCDPPTAEEMTQIREPPKMAPTKL